MRASATSTACLTFKTVCYALRKGTRFKRLMEGKGQYQLGQLLGGGVAIVSRQAVLAGDAGDLPIEVGVGLARGPILLI